MTFTARWRKILQFYIPKLFHVADYADDTESIGDEDKTVIIASVISEVEKKK